MCPSLNDFIALLDDPKKLRSLVESQRGAECNDESILGFLAFYDSLDGDCTKIKHQLLLNKQAVLRPLTHEEKRFSPMKYMRYAALAVVLIGSAIFYYLYTISLPLELKNTYRDPGIPSFMGNTAEHCLPEIMFHYRTGDYKTAGKLAHVYWMENPDNDTLIYYSGLLDNYNGKEELALQKMHQLIKKRSPYSVHANYTIGLIFVQQKRYQSALKTFEKVAKSMVEPFSSFAAEHVEELQKAIDPAQQQAK
jgi:tetratricopeptide (TPR) repeat protein